MKKYFAFFLVLMLPMMAHAQFLKFGIRGGLNTSHLNLDKKLVVTPGSEEYVLEGLKDATYGFHFGAFMRVKVAMLSLQPELIFTSTGGEVKVTDINGVEDIKNMNFNRVNVPLLVGLNIGPLRLHGGPVGTFTISSTSDLFNYEDNLKAATFGYQAGIGIDLLKKITFDVRHEGNLSKLGSGVTIGGQDFTLDTRNPQWIFSLGLFF
ncbi:MAG: PorT family protein [Chlorobi bacterium]|nr:PorT family protein [Chlorobiota bacterium]